MSHILIVPWIYKTLPPYKTQYVAITKKASLGRLGKVNNASELDILHRHYLQWDNSLIKLLYYFYKIIN